MLPFLTSLATVFLINSVSAQAVDPLSYVDVLIGTANGGNVFAGSTLPYGMAKAVADTDSDSDQGGFTTDGANITGFSQMHDSGTGGSPSLGLFALFPYAGCDGDDINRCVFPKLARATQFSNDSLIARPGFFSVTLNSGINVSMTSTQHTNLFRFDFPASGTTSPVILLDLTDLSDSRQDNGTITLDGTSGRMTGNARFLPSFAQGNYVAYFCADFQGSSLRDNGIFANSRASTDVKQLTVSRGINGFPLPGGGFNRFNGPADSPIYARVGVSLVSEDQACSNAEAEIPDYDFDRVRNAAVDQFRQKLAPIAASPNGVDRSYLVNFYSGIYRAFVQPQDYTGENPLYQSGEPYFDSLYCIWDLFRSQLPLLTITDPDTLARIIRSLIETQKQLGWLPDCRMSLSKGYTQGGSNADIVLTDAYLKGINASINWADGYTAVVKDAEEEPFDWCCEGRGGLDSWKSLGYIPVEDFDYKGFGPFTRSISRTLEYSYNDFSISQLSTLVASSPTDAQKYLARSGSWKNLFKANQTSLVNGTDTGFTGFFQPRYLNGTFGFQDPLECSDYGSATSRPCSLQNTGPETYESSIWEYFFYVPHDQASLITLAGGPARYVERLEYLHDNNITYIGNEPSFLTVFAYHYAGRPGLSAKRSHFYIPDQFRTTNDGLPGNDDSGVMGSFVAFNMIGLYPSPGQDVYLIIPPYFEEVNITSPVTGAVARIRNINFDATYGSIYIQNATLDGVAYTKNWIDHSFFLQGKELVLTLGPTESSWGTRVEDLPPSVGEYVGYNTTSSGTNATVLRGSDRKVDAAAAGTTLAGGMREMSVLPNVYVGAKVGDKVSDDRGKRREQVCLVDGSLEQDLCK